VGVGDQCLTSVVAAILAVMLAMSVGFRAVGICALAIYVIGVAALYGARHRSRANGDIPASSMQRPS